MKGHRNFLFITALGSAVFSLVIFGYFGYLSALNVPRGGASGFAIESPLLPTGWETYSGDGWSVGHPADYVTTTLNNGGVSFLPTGADEEKVYFEVSPQTKTLSAIVMERAAGQYHTPVNVMIANYPGLKYSTGVARADFFIDHTDRVYEITSDFFTDPIISTMFATFQFE